MWWVLIGIVDVNTGGPFRLKSIIYHYVQDFVHNYVHQSFSVESTYHISHIILYLFVSVSVVHHYSMYKVLHQQLPQQQ